VEVEGAVNAEDVAAGKAGVDAVEPKGNEPEAVSDGAGAEAGADPPNMNMPDEGADVAGSEGVSAGAPNEKIDDAAGVLHGAANVLPPNGALAAVEAEKGSVRHHTHHTRWEQEGSVDTYRWARPSRPWCLPPLSWRGLRKRCRRSQS
jgi:hypothetical protein